MHPAMYRAVDDRADQMARSELRERFIREVASTGIFSVRAVLLSISSDQLLMNASKSALIVSACVVGMPWGKSL